MLDSNARLLAGELAQRPRCAWRLASVHFVDSRVSQDVVVGIIDNAEWPGKSW